MDKSTINALEKGVYYYENSNFIGILIINYKIRKWYLKKKDGKVKKGNLLVYDNNIQITDCIYTNIIKFDLPLNMSMSKSSNSNVTICFT